jgi:hypothetical protein
MSEKYEGLNLPQLLDLMHDIVMPEAVVMTPQTEGWLVVAGWSAAVAALAAIKIAQRRRRDRYRRDALAELDRIDTRSDTAAGEIASIVKRTALVAYPRSEVASLYGAAWAEFLVESAGNDSRVEKAAPRMADAPYKHGIEAKEIIKPAKRWVKVHRA